jgi:hypothetical protein
MLKENDEKKIIARQILQNNLAEIDDNAQQETYDRWRYEVMSFSSFWGDFLYSAVEKSGNAFDNIVDQFDDMLKRMAIRAAIAGIFNYLTGGQGGFVGGAIQGFMGSFQSGGYTGNTGGIVHANEYVMNKKAVDYYGVSFFDRLGKMAGGNSSYQTTMQFNSADTKAMINENDEMLAQRINTLIQHRKIKLGN